MDCLSRGPSLDFRVKKCLPGVGFVTCMSSSPGRMFKISQIINKDAVLQNPVEENAFGLISPQTSLVGLVAAI